MFSFRVNMETIGSIYSQEYQVKLGHNYLDVDFYFQCCTQFDHETAVKRKETKQNLPIITIYKLFVMCSFVKLKGG